jgi:glycosyltransferase involved in cell wall biosynthesis
LHILHVTTFLQGGAGGVIASLAIAQRRAGHAVTVAADAGGEPGYASYPEYLAALTDARVELHSVSSTFKRDLTLNVHAAQQLRDILGGRRVDVAHTHAAIPTMVTRLALAGRRYTPLLQTMHGWGVRKDAAQTATDVTLLGLTDAVTVPSVAARQMLCGLRVDTARIHVIPYGLEPEIAECPPDVADAVLFARLRAEGMAIALCIGTIGVRKNQALLIRALASLDGVAGVFIGDGEAASLGALARELGIADRVHVLGHRAAASRYLPLADALVLPSMNEGLPIAVLEALRAGAIVVGSRIPEIAEAVDDGRTGLLFEPGDADALAVALRRALESPVRAAMSAAARAAFHARYQMETMIAAYERLYTAVAARTT